MDEDSRTFLNTFERLGWFTTDALNIYMVNMETPVSIDKVHISLDIVIRDLSFNDAISFFDREKDLFLDARVYRDPNIPKDKARKFYRELFIFIFNKPESIGLGLYKGERLIGIILGEKDFLLQNKVNFKLSYLWEIGMSSEFRGFGYSKLLLEGFLKRMSLDNKFVEIGTQVDNIPANRLYNSCGLKLVSNASSLHKWFE